MGVVQVGDRTRTRSNNRFLLGDSYDWGQVSKYVREDANATTKTGRVQAGTLMGIHTASGLYLPCGVGVVPDGAEGASADQVVGDASVFRVGDNVDVYEDDNATLISGNLTVNAIDLDTNTLTLSSSVTTVSESVIRRDDGTETPVGVNRDAVSTVKTHDQDGNPVHSKAAFYLMDKAILDWRYVIGANAITLAALQANSSLNFTIRNA